MSTRLWLLHHLVLQLWLQHLRALHTFWALHPQSLLCLSSRSRRTNATAAGGAGPPLMVAPPQQQQVLLQAAHKQADGVVHQQQVPVQAVHGQTSGFPQQSSSCINKFPCSQTPLCLGNSSGTPFLHSHLLKKTTRCWLN
jgi:hypothetical protein